jgi:hypothetical protein
LVIPAVRVVGVRQRRRYPTTLHELVLLRTTSEHKVLVVFASSSRCVAVGV